MDVKLNVRRMPGLGLLSNEELALLASNGRGVDLQSRDSSGRTTLHNAVRDRQLEVAAMYLENGADPNVADDCGETVLLAAAKGYQADQLLPLLLKHGADATARDNEGRNALHFLPQIGMVPRTLLEPVRALIARGISLDDRERDTGYQPIHVACSHKQTLLAKSYLDHGSSVNVQAQFGEFPLYLAARGASSAALLEILLKRGANIDMVTTNTGQTALHAVCDEPLIDSMRESIGLLLSSGANVLAEDHEGNTPLALVRRHLFRSSLHGHGYDMAPDLIPMLKAIASRKACLPASIELKDERIIIENYSGVWNFYEDCIRRITKAKSTMIIEGCTFFQLLTKCHCQIAQLMRNRLFARNFELYDRDHVFSMYAPDMLKAFARAENLYYSMLEQEDLINEAFYNMLPDLVVRKVVGYIFECRMRRCTHHADVIAHR